jgi:hypothetical protein
MQYVYVAIISTWDREMPYPLVGSEAGPLLERVRQLAIELEEELEIFLDDRENASPTPGYCVINGQAKSFGFEIYLEEVQ